MTNKYNLSTNRGDSFIFNARFKDSSGVPFDIITWVVYFTLMNDDDDEIAFEVTNTTHIDPTNGLSRITMTKDDTAELIGNYRYEIRVDIAGTIYTPLTGYILFEQRLRNAE